MWSVCGHFVIYYIYNLGMADIKTEQSSVPSLQSTTTAAPERFYFRFTAKHKNGSEYTFDAYDVFWWTVCGVAAAMLGIYFGMAIYMCVNRGMHDVVSDTNTLWKDVTGMMEDYCELKSADTKRCDTWYNTLANNTERWVVIETWRTVARSSRWDYYPWDIPRPLVGGHFEAVLSHPRMRCYAQQTGGKK